MGLYRRSSHVYWRCKYHIVWTPKYRFRILRDKLGKELYRTIYILCGIKDCEVLELNVQPDHVHLVVIVLNIYSDGAPERSQCNQALQTIPAYQEEVMVKPFLVAGLLCRYGRREQRNYQTICEASGKNGTNT